ncbi:MAG: hypothetical protein ACR2PA_19155 [Hyphomicrobiaceae bacterium]
MAPRTHPKNTGRFSAQLDDVGINATGNLGSELVLAHIKAAAHAAREARKLEQTRNGSENHSLLIKMMIHVSVSITFAAASIEAAVNEWIKHVSENPNAYQLDPSQTKLTQKLFVDRKGNATSRFELLCLYRGTIPNTETDANKNARQLGQLRNKFMHFRPTWFDNPVDGKKLVNILKEEKIPFYHGYEDCLEIPYGFMTYGWARWAAYAAVNFVMHNSEKQNFNNKFSKHERHWRLPES